MIDLNTRNKLVECEIGFYSPDTQEFYIVEPFLGVKSGAGYILYIHRKQLYRYKVLRILKPQDLADALSVYHKEKFNADKRNHS